ncbi:MAG: DUF2254 domain-containing protein [Nitrosospira sp.]|nr:DUF2254 domain-containing protein [Nitrosospira sp.]
MNVPKRFWIYLRSSFWFMPSLIVAGSIALALGLIEADSMIGDDALARWPRLFGAGADGGREMLSTIAASMMAVVGVTFSMTLVALSLASSQYTSRVLGNFMRSRVTQAVLGIFGGIFTYCLIVLRTIRGGDEAFVPSLAISVGVLLALAGVGVLILFIHHIATSIQASNIICSIADETLTAIDRVFAENTAQAQEDGGVQSLQALVERDLDWQIVPAGESGYIQSVDYSKLLCFACDHAVILQMNHGIGEFVVKNTALASIALDQPLDKETIEAIRSFYSVNSRRTIEQDPAFGIRQLVDVALKALSPGVNDTTTAVTCINYLTVILSYLAPRQFPSQHLYGEGELRVITIFPPFESLLAASFDEIRDSAKGNLAVMSCILGSLKTFATLTSATRRRGAIREQAQWISELANRTLEFAHERELIDNRLANVYKTLEDEPRLEEDSE